MSAEIIQFIPLPNPCRPTLLETKEAEAAEFLEHNPALSHILAGDRILKPDFCELRK